MFAPTGFIPVSALFGKIPPEFSEWVSDNYKPTLIDNYWYTYKDMIERFLFEIIEDNIFIICSNIRVPHRIFSDHMFTLNDAYWAMDILRAQDDEDMLVNFEASELQEAGRRLVIENKLTFRARNFYNLTLDEKEKYIQASHTEKYFNTVLPFIDRRSYSLSAKAYKAFTVLNQYVNGFNSEPEFLLKHFKGCPLAIKQDFFDDFWDKKFQSILSVLKREPDMVKFKSKSGRPRKRDKIADSYKEKFPNGHEPLTWKEVCLEISNDLGGTVTVDTLKRGLGLKE